LSNLASAPTGSDSTDGRDEIGQPPSDPDANICSCGAGEHKQKYDRRAYCYALGLDSAYPELIAEAVVAFERIFPPSKAHRYRWDELNREIVQISNVALLVAFPQHGPGRKHKRKIELTDWQLELTRAHPGALVRGLIHSDGCRTINRFTTKLPSGRTKEYAYPRYFFSNESADIRAIFCAHVELLGVRWSQSNRRNISISDKKSVATLDEVVGPKS
jgi:hypothetical protein